MVKRTREWMILGVFKSFPGTPLTARKVMQELGFQEPNAVRPRITNMTDRGELIVVDKEGLGISGKKVCRWGLPRVRQQKEFWS